LAKPQDAKTITNLIKEVYEGTYPYKEMKNEVAVREMIESGKYIFILFMTKTHEIIGSTTFAVDLERKKGNMRTWVVKKEYHGKFESTKSFIGCCIYVWSLFKDKIYIWYGEVRTAHAKTQYILDLISLKAIGFYPNKDVFYDRIESDILQVSYNKNALTKFRSKKIPKILTEVERLYIYVKDLYKLGSYELKNPKICLDPKKIAQARKNLLHSVDIDKFGYSYIKIFLKNSKSYLRFLYTPTVQNFEKTEYKVQDLEELFVLVQEFIKWAKELDVRYYEIFVSAYKPRHQKIFLDAGFLPRGYSPSWDYNKQNKCFEDRILFNSYKGELDNEVILFKETKKFLKILQFEFP
jgi:hypothetical protein